VSEDDAEGEGRRGGECGKTRRRVREDEAVGESGGGSLRIRT
jgi:hypothetical protein